MGLDTAQSATERRAIFDVINRMPSEPNGPSRASLLKMLQHVDTLICPHRLKSRRYTHRDIATVFGFCHYTCKNTKCSVGHSSELRGIPKPRFQWDQSKLAGNLVLSDEYAVVDTTPGSTNTARSARASTPCVDIVVESMGLWGSHIRSGLVSESFDEFETKVVHYEWGFQRYSSQHTSYVKRATVTQFRPHN